MCCKASRRQPGGFHLPPHMLQSSGSTSYKRVLTSFGPHLHGPPSSHSVGKKFERKQRGVFVVNGRFWRMCLRSRFLYCRSVPSFWLLYRRSVFWCPGSRVFVGVQEDPPKPPFSKPPRVFANPRKPSGISSLQDFISFGLSHVIILSHTVMMQPLWLIKTQPHY